MRRFVILFFENCASHLISLHTDEAEQPLFQNRDIVKNWVFDCNVIAPLVWFRFSLVYRRSTWLNLFKIYFGFPK